MNERLIELIQQCREPFEREVDLEKFALLIIKECAAFVDNNTGYDERNNVYPVEGADIIKYFEC